MSDDGFDSDDSGGSTPGKSGGTDKDEPTPSPATTQWGAKRPRVAARSLTEAAAALLVAEAQSMLGALGGGAAAVTATTAATAASAAAAMAAAAPPPPQTDVQAAVPSPDQTEQAAQAATTAGGTTEAISAAGEEIVVPVPVAEPAEPTEMKGPTGAAAAAVSVEQPAAAGTVSPVATTTPAPDAATPTVEVGGGSPAPPADDDWLSPQSLAGGDTGKPPAAEGAGVTDREAPPMQQLLVALGRDSTE